MKFYSILLISVISACKGFGQPTLEQSQKKTVLQVIEAIIKKDSTKFYSIVDTPYLSRQHIVYDFKFLNKRFQQLKSPVTIDSIKHFIVPNSIWKWNYKTRVYILNSKWNYIDLTFMFNPEVSNKIFYFSKEVQFLNEPLIQAPGLK